VKVNLTAEQLFDAHAMLSDPSTAVEGTRLLQLAARTQEDIDRSNELLERSRMMEASSIADQWIKKTSDFYGCPENIKTMIDFMGEKGVNWAVTKKNLQMAWDILREQGILVDRPAEGEVEAPAVPTPSRRVITPAAAPAVPQTARPTPPLRRPLNNTSVSGPSQTRAREEVGGGTARVTAMDATEYASIGATDMRARYAKDLAFRARVDAYWAGGGR
jgi:hypothetical protein